MEIVTAKEAARLIETGWTITTGGFGCCGHPEAITAALAERYEQSREPKGLTLVFAAGQGDRANAGLNRLAQDGLLRRVVGGYWGLVPRLARLAQENKIEAYNFPQGIVSQLFRTIAAKGPGIISRVGLHTFVDPRNDGGRLSKSAIEDLIKLVQLNGEEYLFYPSVPINCAILRGTRADDNGNVSLDREVNIPEVLAQAQAARNSGGIVIVQVQEIVRTGDIAPQDVRIPGILVDYVVVALPEHHRQTYAEHFNPGYIAPAGRDPIVGESALLLDSKKIIARRALLELERMRRPVVNLGIGTPEYISAVAREEGVSDFVLTVEGGTIGGNPAGGLSFGASLYPEAIIDQPALFDFYDGGGIDVAFLGCAQVDSNGNVNVSRFGNRMTGVGGFVNISQNAKKVVFCGTFTTNGLAVQATAGRLFIEREGSTRKFVEHVSQVTYAAQHGQRGGQDVVYITERAVFRIVGGELTLMEIAPGVDIERDILSVAEAKIAVSPRVKKMDHRIFEPYPMYRARLAS
jgi:propionate CoA-transferase